MRASTPILMPKLGLTMTEGVVARWIAQVGQRVTPGEVLVVIETEKTATDVEAPAGGVLDEVLVPAGEKVPVGTVLGRLRPDGAAGAVAHSPRRVIATPLARRIARERSVDLAVVQGSGPGGRIKGADVIAHSDALPPSGPPPISPRPDLGGELVTPTPFHLAMARRVAQAKREIPHFYLSSEAEVGLLLDYRRTRNESPGGRRITLNHLVVKAVGQALREQPAANVVWRDDGLLRLAATDVGIAVDTDRGVALAMVRGVDQLSVAEVAERADAAADRARRARLRDDDVGGGATSVSNVGMHGATLLAPIIHPPQSSILGVGAIRELFRPGPDGAPRLRREVGLVLACDHRVLDGVAALRFLNAVIALLENPLRLDGA